MSTMGFYACALAALCGCGSHAARPPPAEVCVAQTQIPRAECEALTALRHTTTNWDDAPDPADRLLHVVPWLTGDAPCSWPGVTCEHGHVTELDPRGHLRGHIPAELGDLTELHVLMLSLGELTGPIPPGLARLTHLRHLDLSDNALTGPLPAELAALRELAEIDLFGNELSGPIPPQLGRLPALRTLRLHANRFDGPLPPELGDIATLESLNLARNRLTGPIPPELGHLTHLEILDLSDNALTGEVPTSLVERPTLTSLSLTGNGCFTADARIVERLSTLSGPWNAGCARAAQ